VIVGSEMLYPFQRAKIEAVFGARVRAFYGMSERAAFAAECEHGRMHVHPEYSVVEIVDRDGRPTDGEGFIVGTTLHEAVMPLLRYRLTDTARWDPRPCPCGRTYPVIEALGGKIEDRVFDLKGRAITAAVVGFAYKGLTGIRKGQIAQTARDRWVARLVPGTGYTAADRERFLQNVRTYVSADVNIAIEEVDDIPALPSGKYKWVSQEWRRTA
jgi:phenylacetate-CoA ligase